MSGLLFYTPYEAKRNEFAVSEFCDNLDVRLVYDDCRDDGDFVINRTDNSEISLYYEQRGIRTFNSAEFSALANDKQKCYDFMESKGIPIMPTRYNKLPLVAKPKDGKGGRDVRLITKEPIPNDDNLVLQKCASDIGRDLRVWVIGNEIKACALRQSDSDFRSNFCLGGKASIYTLTPDEKCLVERIILLVRGDYYGIDFVFDNGNIVFNELEDAVGARMVYSLTDIDIISLYCKYIEDMLK